MRGTDNPEYQIANATPNDEWDKWDNYRDCDIENAQSWQYANRYYTGAQDLDQYGQWKIPPTTVMSGPPMSGRNGYPIITAIGRGSLIGDGPGFPMNPGLGALPLWPLVLVG